MYKCLIRDQSVLCVVCVHTAKDTLMAASSHKAVIKRRPVFGSTSRNISDPESTGSGGGRLTERT